MLIKRNQGPNKVEVVGLGDQDPATAAVGVAPFPKADIVTQSATAGDLLELGLGKTRAKWAPQYEQ